MAFQAILASSSTAAAFPSVGASSSAHQSPVSHSPSHHHYSHPEIESALNARLLQLNYSSSAILFPNSNASYSILSYSIPYSFFSELLQVWFITIFIVIFPRYQRFVREGGSADYSDYLEAILPSLLDGLEGAEVYQLRPRRSGSDRIKIAKIAKIAAKEEEIKKAKEVTQLNRLNKAPSGPMGFQVPLSIYSLSTDFYYPTISSYFCAQYLVSNVLPSRILGARMRMLTGLA